MIQNKTGYYSDTRFRILELEHWIHWNNENEENWICKYSKRKIEHKSSSDLIKKKTNVFKSEEFETPYS